MHCLNRSIAINTSKTKTHQSPQAEDNRDFICKVQDAFRVFARKASEVLGTAWSFVIAIAIIVVWGLSGHIFHYSDTWQLIINTGTTIVTFLMVFLIQNTQNRDSKAVNLKLDELIRAVGGARNHMIDLDRLSDNELKELQAEFERIGKRADASKAQAKEVNAEIASR
ncbi:MAG: low affinity iron permease family protein [Verrucomicrobiota bacterium]|nr:low affinity iron permease family protein [Verrucomicrobiota bacterium]